MRPDDELAVVDVIALALILLAALAGWAGAWLVGRFAGPLGLLQSPNPRSSHVRPTPGGGGVGIVVGVSVAGVLAWFDGRVGAQWLAVLGLAGGLALVGLCDDRQPLPARWRLLAQALVCAALLWLTGPGLAASGLPASGLPASGPLVPGLPVLGQALLLLGALWWLNLFNFMDGIDGIAGSQAAFMAAAAAALALFASAAPLSGPVLGLLCVAAASLGFLRLNWPPARVFMGDVGSLWLAFMLLALALSTTAQDLVRPAAWAVLAALFVSDASVTLARRLLTGQRWTEAHRSHAYQRLARRLGGHRPVTRLAIVINLVWLLPLAALAQMRPDWAWASVAAAYLPLLAGAAALGAGRPV